MSVRESEALSQSIACLYDAVLDSAKWSLALESASGFIGGGAANLIWQDAATNEVAVFHSWNENPKYTKLYSEKYASLNPYFPALAFIEVGKVVAGGDLMPHDQFRKTRFYQEWLRPQNFVDVIGANLDRNATRPAFFSVRRHEHHGIVDEITRQRCALIVPHVRRAVAIGKVVERGGINENLLEAALGRLPSAAAVVTAQGHIIFANRKAEEHFRQKDIFFSQDDVFHAANARADQILKDAFAAAERGDIPLGMKGIEVVLSSSNKRKHVAHVLPLASDVRRSSLAEGGVAALFVDEVALASASPLQTISQRFGLTPSEMRVLAVVVRQGGMREISECLGISVATVKTHLNHIFAKTGTQRQADLVRLAAVLLTAI